MLPLHERCVHALPAKELLVVAGLHDTSGVDDVDVVGVLHSGEAVRDHEARAALLCVVQCRLNDLPSENEFFQWRIQDYTGCVHLSTARGLGVKIIESVHGYSILNIFEPYSYIIFV